MESTQFQQELIKIGITLTEHQLKQFSTYLDELQKWNAEMNLTAIRTPEDIIAKHFFDSLTVAQALPKDIQTIADIGTGAGFPGIPLKIIFPTLNLTLVDSVAKKVDFLNHIISTLGLSTTKALSARAEELGHMPEYREAFDVVVGRAVAPLSVLAEYSLPLVKVGGVWISQKGSQSESVETAEHALSELGGTFDRSIAVEFPFLQHRQLLVITKTSKTPDIYPRRIGVPSKKPL